jgi:hypothetical protein
VLLSARECVSSSRGTTTVLPPYLRVEPSGWWPEKQFPEKLRKVRFFRSRRVVVTYPVSALEARESLCMPVRVKSTAGRATMKALEVRESSLSAVVQGGGADGSEPARRLTEMLSTRRVSALV